MYGEQVLIPKLSMIFRIVIQKVILSFRIKIFFITFAPIIPHKRNDTTTITRHYRKKTVCW